MSSSSGNCRSSKRRTTRCLCATLLQGGGSNAAAEAVGAEPIFPNDRGTMSSYRLDAENPYRQQGGACGRLPMSEEFARRRRTTVPRLIRMGAIEADMPQGEPLPRD